MHRRRLQNSGPRFGWAGASWLLLGLLFGCGSAEFPGRESPFTGASDVPFVTTYNFGFRVGFSPVGSPDGNLIIVSEGDQLNFISAANITQRPGKAVVSGVVKGFAGPSAENVILMMTDAAGNPIGDIFYNELGGTPDFIRVIGTSQTGSFTAFNVDPCMVDPCDDDLAVHRGEVFLKAMKGARGNTQFRAFPESVSMVLLQVVRLGINTVGTVVSIGEANRVIPTVPVGVLLVGAPADQDADGVKNELDICPGTSPATPADVNGCAEGQAVTGPIDRGFLSVSGDGGVARFTVEAEGNYIIKLFDDEVDHFDTYHELNTSRASLAGTQAVDLTKFAIVYSYDIMDILEQEAEVEQLPGRGIIVGNVFESDGDRALGAVIRVTNAAGQTLEELGGKVVYTENLTGDPNPALTATTQDGGYMIFNAPVETLFLTLTEQSNEAGQIGRASGTGVVEPVADSVYVKDFFLLEIPPPDLLSPQIPPAFTVEVSGTVKEGLGPEPVAGAQVGVAGMADSLANTDIQGDYAILAAADPAVREPLLAGSFYIFKVSKGPETDGTTYRDTYQEFVTGSNSGSTPRGDFILFSQDTLDTYALRAGVDQDPNKGILIGTLFDLQGGRAAPGVSVAVRDHFADDVGEVFYFNDEDDMPDPSLTETARNGKYIAFNVPPGRVYLGVTSPEDSGNDILQAFPSGVTLKNLGVNNSLPPTVRVSGTVKEVALGGAGEVRDPVGQVGLLALGGDVRYDESGKLVRLETTSKADGTYRFEQSPYTRQIIRAKPEGGDASYFTTYNYDFRVFGESRSGRELVVAPRGKITNLAAGAGVAMDPLKGVILGEVQVPDLTKGGTICADGNDSSGGCGSEVPVVIDGDFFNEDRLMDIAVLLKDPVTGQGRVTIFFGNGDGTFRPSGSFSSVGVEPVDMIARDLNRDATPDLVVLNQESKTFSVLIGSRTGRFPSAPSQNATNALTPEALAIGDFNNDFKQDILVIDSEGNTARIFLGDGRGAFRESSSENLPSPVLLPPCDPVDVALVTLDADALIDWVLACPAASGDTGSLVLLRSQSGFDTAPLPPFMDPRKLVLADYNFDGQPDITIMGLNTNPDETGDDVEEKKFGKLAVVMSNGNNFIKLLDAPPQDIALADFGNDSFFDLVVTQEGLGEASVFLGVLGGDFGDPIPISLGGSLGRAALGDFDGNSISDFVVADLSTNELIAALTTEVLVSREVALETLDLDGNNVGEVLYLRPDGSPTRESSEGDGRFLVLNVPPGLTVLRTTLGGSANKNLTVYPDSVSHVALTVGGAAPQNVRLPVEGVTADAVARPVGDVDIFFVGDGTTTFSSPIRLLETGVVGAAYSTFLEYNSEYIVRLTKVGGGGLPPAPGDLDFDSIDDRLDDCPGIFNPAQTDTDADGLGDACDPNPTG